MKTRLEAYRILCPSAGRPGVAIDIYGKNAVIHVFDAAAAIYLQDIEKALREILGITDYYYKNRTDKPLKLPKELHKEIVVREGGCKFLINLNDYLDTGLFLDHRETRKWIGSLCAGKTVLNTFAYTGSFSVYAAMGGAAKTYSVDLSKTYCEWIKKNLELNSLPAATNWVYKMDTFEFFKYARRKKLTFDIIIIDPPTFSKNKGKSFSVLNDHPRLLNSALELLAPGGFIFFSTNRREFRLKESALKTRNIKEKRDTYPPDFAGAFPHKCYVIRK